VELPTEKSPVPAAQEVSSGSLQDQVNESAVTVALPVKTSVLPLCRSVAAFDDTGSIVKIANAGNAAQAVLPSRSKTDVAEARTTFGSAAPEKRENFILCSSIQSGLAPDQLFIYGQSLNASHTSF
jgi:hypothetical protein